MKDAERYQKEFDLLMQEVNADADFAETSDRQKIWERFGKELTKTLEKTLPPEYREEAKEAILDRAVLELRKREGRA